MHVNMGCFFPFKTAKPLMNLSIATASADLTIYDEMSISEATPHAAFFGLATSLIFRL
jgi:hypothetical protein